MSYTDTQIMYSLGQVDSFTVNNPAVLTEHYRLKENALAAMRSWFAMNIAERTFKGSAQLEKASRELLEFEGRHGLWLKQ